MNLSELLNCLCFTTPYSIADAREALEMIHAASPGSIADVHSPRGTQVFVEVRTKAGTISRVYDVV